jgi:hypothetical protein
MSTVSFFYINQQSNELLPPTSTGNTVKANGLNEQQRPAQHEPSTGPLQFLLLPVSVWQRHLLDTGDWTSHQRDASRRRVARERETKAIFSSKIFKIPRHNGYIYI